MRKLTLSLIAAAALLAVAAVAALLAAGCGIRRYELATPNPATVCRLDTYTGEVVCASRSYTPTGRWTAIPGLAWEED